VKRAIHSLAAGLLVACALLGFATAFGLAGRAGAQGTTSTTSSEPPATTTTGTTTTDTTTTSTEPQPTVPQAPPPPKPAPIPFGVTVGGVRVGGLTPARATTLVERSFTRPLVLVVDAETRTSLRPGALGANAKVEKAIRRARVARPGARVPLDVTVPRERIRAYVDRLGRRYDRSPADARLVLDALRPRAVPARIGRHLREPATGLAIRKALAGNTRVPMRLPFVTTKPDVMSVKFDKAIVIMRGSNRLLLWSPTKLVRSFEVATGQAAYPTPLGAYEIVVKQENPWWYPPPSPWATNEQPVPPGPGNPLGTRWMGLSAPYVGIHGTPDAASIGYSASHGCIRMRIPDAEWLFTRVDIGTPVIIVAR
jgi:lipoprotein-anchoring transpeptidase ErfK/SrfK